MAVLIAISVAGAAFLIVAISRAFRRELTKSGPSSHGFVLADLRDLHRSGQLSDEEYERARASLLNDPRELGSDPNASSSPSLSALTGLGRAEARGFDVIVKPDDPDD
jgi:hypothetical protein